MRPQHRTIIWLSFVLAKGFFSELARPGYTTSFHIGFHFHDYHLLSLSLFRFFSCCVHFGLDIAYLRL